MEIGRHPNREFFWDISFFLRSEWAINIFFLDKIKEIGTKRKFLKKKL